MIRILSACLLTMFLVPFAHAAEPDAKAYHEYREQLFESFGKHMKAMSMVVKGTIDRPATDLAPHAAALAEGATLITAMFPAGTGPDKTKTDALATIWTDADGFSKAAQALATEATKLVEVAKSGDMEAAKAQFGAVGKTCGGCHKTFRADDD